VLCSREDKKTAGGVGRWPSTTLGIPTGSATAAPWDRALKATRRLLLSKPQEGGCACLGCGPVDAEEGPGSVMDEPYLLTD